MSVTGYNRYMWKVYCRTNSKTSKQYVGVTSQTLEDRWSLSERTSVKIATLIQHTYYPTRLAHVKHHDRSQRQLMKQLGTMNYDLATHLPEVWSAALLYETPNIVDALITERQMIITLNTRSPNGYNRSPGGEIPRWVRIDTILDALKTSKLAMSTFALAESDNR